MTKWTEEQLQATVARISKAGRVGKFVNLKDAKPQPKEVHVADDKPKQPPKSKYRNVKTVVDGITFDSKKESERYSLLKPLERAKKIYDLQIQVRYPIFINDAKICTYIADFVYKDEDGLEIVEDVKSEFTRKQPVYRLKKKLLKALYDIDIQEV